MDQNDIEKELNNLNFNFISSDQLIVVETINKIKVYQKRKNLLLIIGLVIFTQSFILSCFLIAKYLNLENHIMYIILFSVFACYSALILFIMYFLNIISYLKQTFTLNLINSN